VFTALGDALWPALALVLILEGLLPLIAPQAWRRIFTDMLRLRDGQLRFFGLLSVGAGLLFWYLVAGA
jgi:uncharacterized protein YjeT (DUF2065 family)